MERLTAVAGCEEVVFEDLTTPAEMAKTAAGLAVEAAAREVHFARCRDYVWTRLTGKRRKIDVLFRVKRASETGKKKNFLVAEESIRSAG
jgi:3-hydroxyisobutyrate dehydrogenase-like beta-hydroxyacid dehydrogenase